MTIANSVFIGYPRGLRLNQQSVADNYAAGTGKLLNNILVTRGADTFTVGSGMTATRSTVSALWNATNTTLRGATADQFAALGLSSGVAFGSNVVNAYSAAPPLAVTSGSLSTGASFTDAILTSLQAVTFRGAFGATDWTSGWAEFLPNERAY